MITPGVTFEAPVFSNFSEGGWVQVAGNGSTSSAYAGPQSTYVTWTQLFTPDSSVPLEFAFAAYAGNVQVDTTDCIWNGSSWSTPDPAPNPQAQAYQQLPEPISMIFFGTGLVAVGGYVARRRMLRNA